MLLEQNYVYLQISCRKTVHYKQKKKKKETFTSIKSMQTDFMAQNLTLRAMAPISAGHQRKETESETAP